MQEWINLASAVLALLAALFGLSQYLRFRTRKERQSAVGQAFAVVIAGLGSEVEAERLSSAALVRRFFDRESEYSVGGLPYARDAVHVISAVLRNETTGSVQKLLGDGLASAPSLIRGDFQRVNLRACYWGRAQGESTLDASKADFFRADLSEASLRRAVLRSAYFREAHLVGTVFEDADCRDADFQGADLKGARFGNALLSGADFTDARHIPAAIAAELGADGRFMVERLATSSAKADTSTSRQWRVFVSAPSLLGDSDQIVIEQIRRGLESASVEIVQFLRPDYGQSPALSEITKRISDCDAVIVFGAPQLSVERGQWRQGTKEEAAVAGAFLPTPWNHVEAGIAAGLDKPLCLIRSGVVGGVFDLPANLPSLAEIDARIPGSLATLDSQIASWVHILVGDFSRGKTFSS